MKSVFPQTTRDWDNRLDSLGSSVKVSDDYVTCPFASLDPTPPSEECYPPGKYLFWRVRSKLFNSIPEDM